MKMRCLRFAAIFMAFLIVTMPFYIAQVFAVNPPQIISLNKMAGKDSIPFVRKATQDFWDVSATVYFEEVNASSLATKVRLYDGSQYHPFSTCTNSSGVNTYTCTMKDSADYPPGYFGAGMGARGQYAVTLNDPACSSAEFCKLQIANAVVDARFPTATITTTLPSLTSASSLNVGYEITELSVQGDRSGYCSGIKSIKFYDKTSRAELLSVDVNKSGTCSYKSTASVPLAAIAEGNTSLCISAVDSVGNEDTLDSSCYPITISRTGPSISALTLTDTNEKTPSFVTDSGMTITASLIVTQGIAPFSQAILDASSINIPPAKMNCQRIFITGDNRTNYNCTASFLSKAADAKIIYVNVSDAAGAVTTSSATLTLTLDNTAPKVTSVASNKIYLTNSYFGPKDNTLTVAFEEAGSGVAEATAKMPGVTGIDPITNQTVSGEVKGECSSTQCTWKNLSYAGGPMLSIDISGKDIAGNTFQSTGWTIYADLIQPNISRVVMQAGDGGHNYVTEGDQLKITAYVYDNVAVVADDVQTPLLYANLEGLIGANQTLQVSGCILNETLGSSPTDLQTLWACTWEIPTPLIYDKKNPKLSVPFNLSDVAGNNKVQKVSKFSITWIDALDGRWHFTPEDEITVRQAAKNISANNFDVSFGQQSPAWVDKQILADLTDGFPVAFPVKLTPKGSAVPLKFTNPRCEDGENETGTTYFSEFVRRSYLIVEGASGEKAQQENNAFMTFVISSGGAPEVDNITFRCLFVTEAADGRKMLQPEEDWVNVSIAFKNNPLGEYPAQVPEMIKKLQKNTFVSMEALDTLNMIVHYLTLICSTIGIFYTVYNGYMIMAAAVAAPCTVPAGEAACGPQTMSQALADATNKGTSSAFTQWYYKICGYISCSNGLFGMLFNGVDNGIGTLGKEAIDSQKKFSVDHPNLYGYEKVQDALGSGYGIQAFADPNNNIVAAMAKLCLPAIITNLQKLRSIYCEYIICLKDTKDTTTIKQCTSQFGYQQCAFFFGQLWNLFPFSAILSKLGQLIDGLANFAKGGLGLILLGMKAVCTVVCDFGIKLPGYALCRTCMFIEGAQMWFQALCTLGISMEGFASGSCPGIWKQFDPDSIPNRCPQALEPLNETGKTGGNETTAKPVVTTGV